MKKYGFLLAALFLVGCSTEKTDEAEAPAPASSESSSMMESSTTESSTTESSESEMSSAEDSSMSSSESVDKEEDDEAQVNEQDLIGAKTVSKASDYPELEYAQDKVDFSGLEGYIVADNPNKRVVIFKDDQDQVYKTIFIKKRNYLKVINLQGEGLLLNESIQ